MNQKPETGFYMAKCPSCNTPGAYVGFNSIECRNPRCVHFSIEEEDICPCCGKKGHTPSVDFLRRQRLNPSAPLPETFDPNAIPEGE